MDTIVREKIYENGGGEYGGRRDYATKEKANAALTLGIIGTVAGVAALWGRGSGGSGGGLTTLLTGGSSGSNGGGGSTPSNVNINNTGGGYTYGYSCPSAFQAWSKECEDILALTNAMYGLKIGTMQAATDARNVDVAEKFSLYKSQIDADFGLYINTRNNIDAVNNRINNELFSLYKYTRDKDDETRKELCDLKAQIAVSNAVRPYQDKLIQCEIEKAFTAGINYVDRKTCKMITGQVVIPNDPVVTGFAGVSCCNNNPFPNAG